ncbi:hypothetical protein Hanom_Chr12g01074731 [Helianthus anomalus]
MMLLNDLFVSSRCFRHRLGCDNGSCEYGGGVCGDGGSGDCRRLVWRRQSCCKLDRVPVMVVCSGDDCNMCRMWWWWVEKEEGEMGFLDSGERERWGFVEGNK